MPYTYATAETLLPRGRRSTLFRQSDYRIEVQITHEFRSPDEIKLEDFQLKLSELSEGMRDAIFRTKISTMDEYFQPDIESTLSITGWIPLESDAHKALLEIATPFA